MSVLSYGNSPNTVIFPYCYITDFRQEAIPDDVSNTDWAYMKFDIVVQSVLNYNYLSIIAPDLVGSTKNPADVMNVIRSRLMKPRQELKFSFNGINLIPGKQDSLPGTVDARNGPVPQSCVLKQLTNTTFLFNYHIIAHYWENNQQNQSSPLTTNQPGNAVLFNRWTETVDIDQNNFSTRTREGKFVIRSDNADGKLADELRSQFAVVGVPEGFLRLSSNYTITPDGLGVQYRIIDRESFKLPPSPAFTAQGQFSETGTMKMGMYRMAECWVRLTGDKVTPQAELLQTAIAVANSKVSCDRRRQLALNVPESTSVTVNMYENIVECRVRALTKPRSTPDGKGTVEGLWGYDTVGMVSTPFSDNQTISPPYLDRGTASLLLQAAAYWDPSITSNVLNPVTGQAIQGTSVGTAGIKLEDSSNTPRAGAFTGDNPETDDQSVEVATIIIGSLSDGPDDADYDDLSPPTGIFTDYKVTSRYESDKHIYMMGITSPDGFQGSSVAFTQLASPTLLWIADWTAAKLQETPEIPDFDVLDEDWVLMDEHYEPYMVSVAADGITPIYRLSGTFVYGQVNPTVVVLGQVVFPKAPWVDNLSIRSVDLNNLLQGIITTE